MTLLKKKSLRAVLLLLMMWSVQDLHAAKEKHINRITGSQVLPGATVSTIDNKAARVFSGTGLTFTDEKITNAITVGVDRTRPMFNANDTELNFELKITYKDAASNSHSVQQMMTVGYYKNATLHKDRDIFIFHGGYEVTVEIVNITDVTTGNTISDPEDVFYIENRIESERYYDTFHASTSPAPIVSYDAATDKINLWWYNFPGAEEFDLEWTFVNNYDHLGGKLGVGSLAYDFDKNATRITTNGHTYSINNVFQQGYLLLRMRSVARIKNPATNQWDRLPARWSTNAVGSKNSVLAFQQDGNCANAIIEILPSEIHQSKKNWQYSATYAEGGKRKEVVRYHDGLLRGRQTVTRINSDQQAIVGETFYDFYGRQAVTAMPTPTGDDKLNYYDAFNKATASSAYSWKFFDTDRPTNACIPNVQPMYTGSGASRYYSENNPNKDGINAFIPDAEGFPFTQVEFTNDKTGRIRRQSNVGEKFALGSGHETQFLYGIPSQEELDEMFGSEVGYKTHYRKQAQIDANGQISITYSDMSGNTIATCLAGASPENMKALTDEKGEKLSANVTKKNRDFLGKFSVSDTDTDEDANILSAYGDELVFSGQIMVTQNGEHDFFYDLKGGIFDPDCLPANICYDCVYDLQIDVRNECGEPVSGFPIQKTVGTLEIDTICGNDSAIFELSPNPTTAYLYLGNYTVYKSLKINNNARNAYWDDYMNRSGCIKSYASFVDSAMSTVDSTLCDADSCDTCATYINVCQVTYEMLLSDMSPTGQYAQYLDGSRVNPSKYPLSIFNTANKLPKSYTTTGGVQTSGANWKNPDGGYKDSNGNAAFVEIFKHGNTYQPEIDQAQINQLIYVSGNKYKIAPEHLKNVKDFVRFFDSSWAKALVKYHPEYCYYEWCANNADNNQTVAGIESSWKMDEMLQTIQTLTDATDPTKFGGNPLIDPLGQFSGNQLLDPFFSSGGQGAAYLTDMQNRMLNYNNTGLSIWKAAALTDKCGGVLDPVAMNSCLSSTFNNPSNDLGYINSDNLWMTFRSLYLGEKEKIKSQLADDYAVNNCYGFNECIGTKDFDPFVSGMLSSPNKFPVPNTGAYTSTYFNYQQPCSEDRQDLYIDKVKRFVGADDDFDQYKDGNDILEKKAAEADYQMYQLTGQCPIDLDVEALLSGLVSSNNLLIPGVNLNQNGLISHDLYKLLNPNWASSYVDYISTVTGSTTGKTFYIHPQGNQFGGKQITLKFNSGSSYSFSNTIVAIRNLKFKKVVPGMFYFDIEVSIDHDNDPNTSVVKETLRGTTEIPIGQCSFPEEECKLTDFGIQTLQLWNALSWNGLLHSTNVALSSGGNPVSNQFVSRLEPMLGSANWSWSFNAGLNEFVLNDGSLFSIHYQFVAPIPANIVFKNMRKDPVQSNVYIVDGYLPNGSSFTVQQFYFGISLTNPPSGFNLTLSECQKPVPVFCQTNAYYNKLAIEKYLDQISANINTDFTLNEQTPAFGKQLKAPYTANVFAWNGSNGIINDSTFVGVITEGLGGDTLCQFGLSFNAPVDLVTYNFTNIVGFKNMQATGPSNGGVLTHFTIEAVFANGHIELINGSSCYTIENCCSDQQVVFFQDFSNGTASSNNIPFAMRTSNTYSGITTYPQGQYEKGLLDPNPTPNSPAYGLTPFNFGTGQLKDHTTNSYTAGKFPVFAVSNTQRTKIWEKTFTDLEQNSSYDFCFFSRFIEASCNDLIYTLEINGVKISDYQQSLPWDQTTQTVQLDWEEVCYRFKTDGTVAYTISIFVEDCIDSEVLVALDDISLKPAPCSMSVELKSIDTTFTDRCLEYLVNTAISNATNDYNKYIAKKKKEFFAAYNKGCISSPVENFKYEYGDGSYYYTLYYYDTKGNLIKTVPPKGVNLITSQSKLDAIKQDRKNKSNAASKAIKHKHDLETYYEYNTLNQLVQQQTPDGGVSHFWYDEVGRLALSQNAQQLDDKAFSYSRYDALGRIIETGQVNASLAPGVLAVNDQVVTSQLEIWLSSSNRTEVTRTEYDQPILSNTWQNRFKLGEQRHLINRVSSTIYQEEYDPSLLVFDNAIHYSYDIHGNVDELVRHFPELEGLNQAYKHIGYSYDLISGNVNEVAYNHVDWTNDKSADRFFHRYEYDDDNRILRVLTSRDHVHWEEDASYEYYAHGPLARKDLGELKVHGQDHVYTLQGWMKGVNDHTLYDTKRDPGKDGFQAMDNIHRFGTADVMSYGLNYYGNDYKAIDDANISSQDHFIASTGNISSLFDSAHELFNGNISSMVTSQHDVNDNRNTRSHLNSYRYDQLNRIAHSHEYIELDVEGNEWKDTPLEQKYASNYEYDLNGNLKFMTRYGNKDGNELMDELTYEYIPGTNQLWFVDDAVDKSVYSIDIDDQEEDNYKYDLIGNLKHDIAEEIENIEWTLSGKIKAIQRFDWSEKPDLAFRYDPMGNRIVKIVKPRTDGKLQNEDYWTYTYYVADVNGEVMAIYDKDVNEIDGGSKHSEQLRIKDWNIYGSTREGIVQKNQLLSTVVFESNEEFSDRSFSRDQYFKDDIEEHEFDPIHETGARNYELSNHLGNVLNVISDQRLWNENVLQADHFTEIDADWSNQLASNPSVVNDKLRLETTNQWSGIQKFFSAKPNTTYTISIDVELGTTVTPFLVVFDGHNNAIQFVSNLLVNGRNTFTFTTHSTLSLLRVKLQRNDPTGTITWYDVDNLQVVESDDAKPFYMTDIRSINDYYPFGMLQPGRTYASDGYRYGFQGEEKDDEVKGEGNSISYKYRIHDTRVGRFLSIDPLEKDYPWNSPYAFSENRVIDMIELEGAESAVPGYVKNNVEGLSKEIVKKAEEVQDNIVEASSEISDGIITGLEVIGDYLEAGYKTVSQGQPFSESFSKADGFVNNNWKASDKDHYSLDGPENAPFPQVDLVLEGTGQVKGVGGTASVRLIDRGTAPVTETQGEGFISQVNRDTKFDISLFVEFTIREPSGDTKSAVNQASMKLNYLRFGFIELESSQDGNINVKVGVEASTQPSKGVSLDHKTKKEVVKKRL